MARQPIVRKEKVLQAITDMDLEGVQVNPGSVMKRFGGVGKSKRYSDLIKEYYIEKEALIAKSEDAKAVQLPDHLNEMLEISHKTLFETLSDHIKSAYIESTKMHEIQRSQLREELTSIAKAKKIAEVDFLDATKLKEEELSKLHRELSLKDSEIADLRAQVTALEGTVNALKYELPALLADLQINRDSGVSEHTS